MGFRISPKAPWVHSSNGGLAGTTIAVSGVSLRARAGYLFIPMLGANARRLTVRPAVILLAIVLSYCEGAFALDPSLQISQYGHRTWTVREGFFKGSVLSLAQGAD